MSFSNQIIYPPEIKICGNTQFENVFYATILGVNYIGFIFSNHSPRYIRPPKAKEIIKAVKIELKKKANSNTLKMPKIIGVFVNQKKENILKIANHVPLDIIQLHGEETPSFAHSLKMPFWKVFRIPKTKSPIGLTKSLRSQISTYQSNTFLLDTFSKNKIGGSGSSFDWKILTELKTLSTDHYVKKIRFVLAGGLGLENISQALLHKPEVLDLNSGIEDAPGVKNHQKMLAMIKLIRG